MAAKINVPNTINRDNIISISRNNRAIPLTLPKENNGVINRLSIGNQLIGYSIVFLYDLLLFFVFISSL